MKYIHTPECLGTIDLKKRQCSRCKRKWNRFSLWFDPKGIRPMREAGDVKKMTKQEEVTTVQRLIKQRVPGGTYAVAFANRLPKWPRWARVTVTVVIAGGVVTLITWLVIK
jgi:hypothetical protein